MKLHFANLIGFGGGGGEGRGSYSKMSNLKTLHRNLFMDDFQQNLENDDDEYIEDEELEDGTCNRTDNVYNSAIEKNSKYFKLNHLFMPLTDTIAQISHDLSDDEFFINDLSFVFEISRKRAISPYAIIVALLYLKRLKKKSNQTDLFTNRNANLMISSSNEMGLSNSELCLVSILLASKYLTDEGESNEIYNNDWAEACDIPVKKINSLERLFLKKMNWDLYVSSDEFWSFTTDLTEKITRKKIKSQSNQCTYSDLECLISYSKEFSFDTIKNHLCLLSKVLLVCSSTLIYITLSSLLISTYLAYLKTQIINTIHLTSLTSNINNMSEQINTRLINNTANTREDSDDMFSLDENVEEEIVLMTSTNNTYNMDDKNNAFCFNLNNKLIDFGISLYRIFETDKNIIDYRHDINQKELFSKNKYSGLLPYIDTYSNNKVIDNHEHKILYVNS